jgi:hypothetical protein
MAKLGPSHERASPALHLSRPEIRQRDVAADLDIIERHTPTPSSQV